MRPKRVLLVLSDRGFHWDELADAFHAFRDAGWQVELGSLAGRPKPDERTLRRNIWLRLFGRATTKVRDPESEWWGKPVRDALSQVHKLGKLQLTHYDALCLLGGIEPLFWSKNLAVVPPDLVQHPLLVRWVDAATDAHIYICGRRSVLEANGAVEGSRIIEHDLVFSAETARHTKWAIRKLVKNVEATESNYSFSSASK
jgi:putative intracellular protease/amidase